MKPNRKGVGQTDENGGVDLVVIRQTVHFHIQLRLKQPGFFILVGGLLAMFMINSSMIMKIIVVVLNLFLEASGILLRHPTAPKYKIAGRRAWCRRLNQLTHVESW